MKKLTTLGLATIFSLIGLKGFNQIVDQKIDILNINKTKYCDMNQMNFEEATKPNKLVEIIEKDSYSMRSVNNERSLGGIIMNAFLKQGYDEKKLSTLSENESINLSVTTTINLLDYKYVDSDTTFIKEHGKNLPTEEYMRIGFGDCDKYSNALIEVFNRIKVYNENISNIICCENKGGFFQLHQWNSFMYSKGDSTMITFVDPTSLDKEIPEDIEKGYHVSKNNKIFQLHLLQDLNWFIDLYIDNNPYTKEVFKQATENILTNKKETITTRQEALSLFLDCLENIDGVYKAEACDKELFAENYYDDFKNVIYQEGVKYAKRKEKQIWKDKLTNIKTQRYPICKNIIINDTTSNETRKTYFNLISSYIQTMDEVNESITLLDSFKINKEDKLDLLDGILFKGYLIAKEDKDINLQNYYKNEIKEKIPHSPYNFLIKRNK